MWKEKICEKPVLSSIVLYSIYTTCFFLLEKLDLPSVMIIHSRLDDLIPFSRFAVFPYCLWFAEIAAVMLYVCFRCEKEEFYRSLTLILTTMFLSLLIFLLIPNEIHLRPESVSGNDLAAFLTRAIYAVDNSKNVCPSIHVSVSYLMSDIWKRNTDRRTGVLMILLNIFISVSTLFLKQHSIIDVFWGLIYGFLIRFLYDQRKKKKMLSH